MFYPTVSSFFEAEGDFSENLDGADNEQWETTTPDAVYATDDGDVVQDILDLLKSDPWGQEHVKFISIP